MGKGKLDAARGFLNKWEMYKALRGEKIGPCKLPVTAIFTEHSLMQMLKRFQTVYVKPVDTWGGHNVSLLKVRDGQFLWRMQEGAGQEYSTVQELHDELQKVYAHRSSIVQQGAPIVSYEGKPFDIRVHMQRELDESWVYAGSVARIGGADGVVSNVEISNGTVAPVEDAVTVALDKEKVKRVERHLREVGHHICDTLEGYRKFYEIGIDLGIDAHAQLWLIEVNTDDALSGPSHELFAKLPDKTVYEKIRKRHERRINNLTSLLFETFF